MHWDNFGWAFWHWWHGWTFYFGAYHWLELNNLWKAAIAFAVTLAVGAGLTSIMRPWRTWQYHKEVQEKIADRLDTSTPGGMTDVVKALHRLLDNLDEGEAPDDNGSDFVSGKRRNGVHGVHHVPEPGERSEHSVIPNVHGGGSAGHR